MSQEKNSRNLESNKIGTKAISHARSIILQLAEIAVPCDLWVQMLANIANLKARAQAP